jgi:ketosteroid isomerase-like protein
LQFSEEEIRRIVREVMEALRVGDVEKIFMYDADDMVMSGPNGTFRTRDEQRRVLKGETDQFSDIKFTEKSLLVDGNRAVYEFDAEGKLPDGRKLKMSRVTFFVFEDGKIKETRSYFDRLSIAKQAANGVIQRWVVNSIVDKMEKGAR